MKYAVRWWWWASAGEDGNAFEYSLYMRVEGMQPVWLGDIHFHRGEWHVFLGEGSIGAYSTAREAADFLLNYWRGKEKP